MHELWLIATLPLLYLMRNIYRFCTEPLNKHIPISQKIKDERGQKIFPQPFPHHYPNGWYKVADSAEVKRGQVKGVNCFGEELVVFRGQDGKAAVLNAICPHLGANLAVGGKGVGNCIQCPFHNWEFNCAGKCTKIPYSVEKGKDGIVKPCKIPSNATTKVWKSREINYGIYVWFHAENEPPSWFLTTMVPTLPNGQEMPLVYHGKQSFDAACHIQEVTENGVDYAHFDTLHKKFVFSDIINITQGWNPIKWEPRVKVSTVEDVKTIEDVKTSVNKGAVKDNGITGMATAVKDGNGGKEIKTCDEKVNGKKCAKEENGCCNGIGQNSCCTGMENGCCNEEKNTCKDGNVEKQVEEKNVNEHHVADVEVESWLVLFNKYKVLKFRATAEMVGLGNVFINLRLPFGGILTLVQSVVAVAPNLQLITVSLYGTPWVPKFVSKIFMRFSITISLGKDIEIWNHKTLLTKPVLVKGDGPIGKFRRWAKQFYSKRVSIEEEF